LTCVLSDAFSAALFAKDVPGSKDHSLISRYKGAEIKAYNKMDCNEYALGIAVVKYGVQLINLG